MRAALRSRLERLEVGVEAQKPQLFRSGYLKTLPADYVGERHVVIVKREPAGAPGNEWCEFEERPGPAPVDAPEEDCTTIYIVYRDVGIPQGGRSRAGRDEERTNRCISD
jgi:hypothetical protein